MTLSTEEKRRCWKLISGHISRVFLSRNTKHNLLILKITIMTKKQHLLFLRIARLLILLSVRKSLKAHRSWYLWTHYTIKRMFTKWIWKGLQIQKEKRCFNRRWLPANNNTKKWNINTRKRWSWRMSNLLHQMNRLLSMRMLSLGVWVAWIALLKYMISQLFIAIYTCTVAFAVIKSRRRLLGTLTSLRAGSRSAKQVCLTRFSGKI